MMIYIHAPQHVSMSNTTYLYISPAQTRRCVTTVATSLFTCVSLSLSLSPPPPPSLSTYIYIIIIYIIIIIVMHYLSACLFLPPSLSLIIHTYHNVFNYYLHYNHDDIYTCTTTCKYVKYDLPVHITSPDEMLCNHSCQNSECCTKAKTSNRAIEQPP